MKYTIEVRRIVRESLPITVEANSPEEAQTKAEAEATANSDNPEWDCYDCEYWSELPEHAA